MPFFHKRDKISGRQAKKLYKQLTKSGFSEETAQKIVKLYER